MNRRTCFQTPWHAPPLLSNPAYDPGFLQVCMHWSTNNKMHARRLRAFYRAETRSGNCTQMNKSKFITESSSNGNMRRVEINADYNVENWTNSLTCSTCTNAPIPYIIVLFILHVL